MWLNSLTVLCVRSNSFFSKQVHGSCTTYKKTQVDRTERIVRIRPNWNTTCKHNAGRPGDRVGTDNPGNHHHSTGMGECKQRWLVAGREPGASGRRSAGPGGEEGWRASSEQGRTGGEERGRTQEGQGNKRASTEEKAKDQWRQRTP